MGYARESFRFGVKPLLSFFLSLILLSTTLALPTSLLSAAKAIEVESDAAIDLNGTSQYAYAADSPALRTFNAITIEAWVMPQATCAGNIVAKTNDYALYCVSGNLYYALGGTTSWAGIATTITIPTNEWHHIALTRAANTNVVDLYLDGQKLYSGTADGAGTGAVKSSTTSYLNIGARGQSATFFNGLIDEVRIHNSTRSESQIASDMHTWGNLGLTSVVGYYDFNSVTGSSLLNKAIGADSSSHMTLVGSPTLPTVESTAVSGNDRIVTFPRSYLNSGGGYALTPGVFSFRALVIAGGGGGGNDEGGGGGAGGFIESTTVSWDYSNPIGIQVGQGGLGSNGTIGNYGTDDTLRGENGQDSQLANIVAKGGGAGGTSNNVANDPERNGANGGSGGGGAGESTAGHSAGAGTSGQGFAGGAGIASGIGGGGGGAGAVGNTGGSGKGGSGKASTITGTSVVYAGGGGGGYGNTASGAGATGGSGGGGAGGDYNTAGVAGTKNTGGGGGGGCGAIACGPADQLYSGASGGSGVIIIRFTIDYVAPTFTNAGSFSVNENISITSNAATIQASESSTFTIVNADDSADFTIYILDSDTAYLRFAAPPDFEGPIDIGTNNVYNVTISANDVANNAATQSISITVLNSNEDSSISAPTISAAAFKGISVTLSITSNVAGTVRFFSNGKKIANCLSRPTSGTYPTFTATCSWKPTVQKNQTITAEITPTDTSFSSSKSGELAVFVNKRQTIR